MLSPSKADLLLLPPFDESRRHSGSTASLLSLRSAASKSSASSHVPPPPPQVTPMSRNSSSSSSSSKARAGICFCGKPAVSDRDDDDAGEDEEAIYCGRQCARQDAMQALLARSQGDQKEEPHTPQRQILQDKKVENQNPVHKLPRKPVPSLVSSKQGASSARARIVKRASVTLSKRYPGLDLSMLEPQIEEPEEEQREDIEERGQSSMLGVNLSLRLSMMGTSHYRRMEALSSTDLLSLSGSACSRSSSCSSMDSRESSTSSRDQFVSPLPRSEPSLISEPSEREKARIAALEAPQKARARHARNQAAAPSPSDIAQLLRDAGDDYDGAESAHPGHQAKRSDASDLSRSSVVSSLFDDAGQHMRMDSMDRLGVRSRGTTVSTHDGQERVNISMLLSKRTSSRQLHDKASTAKMGEGYNGLESANVERLRRELQMLDDELTRTFDAFEFDDDEYQDLMGGDNGDDGLDARSFVEEDEEDELEQPYESPVGSNRGSPSPNFLGLDLGTEQAPLPPLVETAHQEIDLIHQEAAPTKSHFEDEDSPDRCAAPSPGSAKSKLKSLWRKGSQPRLCPSLGISSSMELPASPSSPTKRLATPGATSQQERETKVADRLADRLDAVLRGRWGLVKSFSSAQSPP